MGIAVAYVQPRVPVRKTGLEFGQHTVETAAPGPMEGDPFYRHRVMPGEFYTVGKIRSDPGTHRNYYTNIPGIQAIAQQFWGTMFTRLRYKRGITMPRGEMRGLGADVNVNVPATGTPDFATFDGNNREIIHTLSRG